MTDYFKVLVNGRSAHGGDYAWSLPDGEKPGAWTPTIRSPRICEKGYHLTSDPMQWAKVGMAVYAAQPGAIKDAEDDKIVTTRARLLREAPEMIPDWWRGVERFVTEEIPAVPWGIPDGDPDPAWRLFTAPTLAAARDAARAAGRDAAGDAAWDAAGAAAEAAALYTLVTHVCAGLPLDQRHRDHAAARWNVWQRGYCLLCDVDGVLFVCASEEGQDD